MSKKFTLDLSEQAINKHKPQVGDIFESKFGKRLLVRGSGCYHLVCLDSFAIVASSSTRQGMAEDSFYEFIGTMEVKQ